MSSIPLPLAIGLAMLLIIQVINLVQYCRQIINRINLFFESIQNDDFSLIFPAAKGDKLIEKLSTNLRRINRQIHQIRADAYSQEQYFRALIEHVSVGIVSFNPKGFVIHANSRVKQLLGLNQFTHLKQLEKVDTTLYTTFSRIHVNDQRMITFNGKNGNVSLMVKATPFNSSGQQLSLITVQDINQELSEKELDSWLKLIRVLTHEIMNSLAPVTSLSDSLRSFFSPNGEAITAEKVDDKLIQTTIRGLNVICEQGKGLISFVESYRQLTRLPVPDKKWVATKNIVDKAVALGSSYLPNPNIAITTQIHSDCEQIMADKQQVLQILVNLLKNSCEAMSNQSQGEIHIRCQQNTKKQTELSVWDNGPGIPAELMDEVFVPFFTTRENGSGIGLSLSRQIMRLHGGVLKVKSVPEKETEFTMVFNDK